MTTTLYVGNLVAPQDGREVARLFSAYGTVVYAKVVDDPKLLRGGGFGVVQMGTMKEAQKVIQALNNSEYRGRRLNIRSASAIEETAAGHPRMFESMNMRDDAVEKS